MDPLGRIFAPRASVVDPDVGVPSESMQTGHCDVSGAPKDANTLNRLSDTPELLDKLESSTDNAYSDDVTQYTDRGATSQNIYSEASHIEMAALEGAISGLECLM